MCDCNNFFVSCERVFRPDLEGKPVVVLSGNDGCVVSRSNEAKKIGIKMGEPWFEVKRRLGDEAKGTELPIALGVIRNVEEETYDSAVNQQIEQVREHSKVKTFDQLTSTLEQWEV